MMIKTYLFLIGAILCEVAGTMLLPVSQTFTKIIPTAALSIFYLAAFYLLTFVVNKLPIAIVYATWSGLGIFTISILGYVFFKQSLSWQAIMGLFLIILGVVLVNSFTSKVI
jgi:multidrug transporter EmrE-like cation transporter